MNNTRILKIAAFTVIMLLIIAGAYWIYNSYIVNKGKDLTSADNYICPMHPQIVQDRPGICPICGMDLVKKSEMTDEDMEMDHDISGVDLNAVKLSPSQQILANVQTEKVKLKQFSGKKTFNGYVKINEKKFAHISTAISGKIVTMFVNFEGQYVSKGQPVLEIYSPELVATEKEFLLAINNLKQIQKSGNLNAIGHAQSLLEAARTRLSYWEMTDSQIEELENTQNVRKTIIQYSKYSGIITKKYVHVGHWAMPGEDIYDIADLSTVWVIANVYESDVKFIKNGQHAEISTSAYPEEIFNAKVNFVEPIFDASSRTLQVRIDVSNPGNRLKPDMYVKVKLNTFYDQLLAVPKDAVIRKGEHDIVYLETKKGVYLPKQVKVMFEQDGYYAISEGISEGDIIVTSGGFLIDSESQIKAGMTSGHEQNSGPKQENNEDKMKINPDQDIMKDIEKKKQEEHKH